MQEHAPNDTDILIAHCDHCTKTSEDGVHFYHMGGCSVLVNKVKRLQIQMMAANIKDAKHLRKIILDIQPRMRHEVYNLIAPCITKFIPPPFKTLVKEHGPRTPKTLVMLLLLFALPVHAAPKHFWIDKKVLIGEAIIIGSTVGLDGASTCHALHHGVDVNLGIHSCGSAIGIEAAAASFYTLLNYAEWHFGSDDPNKYWRFAAYWSMPAVVAGIHGYDAAHNWSLPTPGEKKLMKYESH